MTKLLVANRGEIAVRIFRTARRMDLGCVAVYSDADVDSPFVLYADESVRIGPAPASESYLRADRIIEAALETGATLVHPGYGFLAESGAFAGACRDAGLTFVGPPGEVLEVMGDKARAKELAVSAGVPVLAGYAGADQSDEAFAKAASEIGYPVLAKAAAGGGGKGMSVIADEASLPEALASARRVATAAFGDGRLILERYVPDPRHVEVQVMADGHGNVIHLGERDCSLQRRHQKVLEESPSPAVDDHLRAQLCAAAVDLARAAGYVNAGTCEFLVGADGGFGFIEMNARLQVEHPVT
ncbi:MAG TPA: biotin carboxylase N-terminal domain-containing protein, partial [Actinomycetota bacterium]|nr:biotin carboxylase N-terminal domain-containing protein [Actinomycetota bacterium]